MLCQKFKQNIFEDFGIYNLNKHIRRYIFTNIQMIFDISIFNLYFNLSILVSIYFLYIILFSIKIIRHINIKP